MKKPILFITGLVILITGFAMYQGRTESASKLPYTKAATCSEAIDNGVTALTQDWRKNVATLAAQPAPTSDSVDDAFENLRTLDCWLQYFCQAVKISSREIARQEAPLSFLGVSQLTPIPGCISPDLIELGDTWGDFLNTIAEPNKQGEKDKFNYVPQCSTNTTSQLELLANIDANITACENRIKTELFKVANSNDSTEINEFKNRSDAYIILEKSLIEAAGKKKAEALEQKLMSISAKLAETETRGNFVKQYFTELEDRIPCILKQCTP